MLLVFLPLCPKGHLPYSRGEAPSGGFSTDFLHTDKLHGSCSPKVGELPERVRGMKKTQQLIRNAIEI